LNDSTNFYPELDAMHEGIKQITETLALHLPPPTPTMESSKKHNATEPASGRELTLESTTEGPTNSTTEPLKADTTETPVEPVTPESEQSPPKRPTLEKRSSVLGSIGKILWPFGSASPTKTVVDGIEVPTVDSSAPKVPAVVVTEVPLTPEIEI
jgi:hypothetical protein